MFVTSQHKETGKEYMHVTPAEYVIRTIGGVRKTARALGLNAGTVSQWRSPKEKRGRGGKVPGRNFQPILTYARQHKLDITAENLVNGGRVPRSR